MAYTKTTWLDRNVSTPTDYVATKGGGGALSSGDTLTMVASPSVVTEAGTPITALVMNNIEDGIEELYNNRLWEQIADYTVLGSPDSQIDFDNLSEEYTHFRLLIGGISSTGLVINVNLRFNDDSGNNYNDENNTADHLTLLNALIGNGIPQKEFLDLMIFNQDANYYKYTKNETMNGGATGGVGRTEREGVWVNTTDKITKISFIPATDSIGINSNFVLFGRR